jgi:hypothetical protein
LTSNETHEAKCHVKPVNLLWGAKAISREIDAPLRQTFYMLENGLIPGKKIGARWCASREVLRRHFEQLSGEVVNQ